MGEIAEMMLEGVLCEGCGEYLGDGDGYPVRCSGCREEPDPTAEYSPTAGQKRRRVKCISHCGKGFRTEDAMLQHNRDKHGPRGRP